MPLVRIHLPDTSVKEFSHEPTVLEVAESLDSRLARETLGGQLNEDPEVVDLRTPLPDGTRLRILTAHHNLESLEVVRHSAAHVMAEAVQELWPEIKVTIGPVIDRGFFYDFHTPRPFTPEDLEKVERKMKEIIKRGEEVHRVVWPVQKAIETFDRIGEKFKVEIIKELNIEQVSIYTQGQWFDLCRGPHVQKTSQIKAIKVLSTSGAYWRGDENKPMLQRIYATAFHKKKDLNEYLHNLEEAKKRDHRKLGKELGLFYFHPLAPGAPFFTEKGTVVYNELQDFIREKYQQYDYKEVITPQIFDVDLYHQSGHYENYRENMYFTELDARSFSIKPMNCPGHCLLYASNKKSYRDLPWRVADFGRLHRHERSGTLHGLTRVVSFCQDDAHIFCTLEQLPSEIASFLKFLDEIYTQLGMGEYEVHLATRPERRMGSDVVWERAEKALEDVLRSSGVVCQIQEGEGAFYGPKLDIVFVDALKRPWQLGTLQCDFNMPEAFDLKYMGKDNLPHRPVLLHRAVLGSLERFIGIYLEHRVGKWPLWLAPIQVIVMNITDTHLEACEKFVEEMKSRGIRAVVDGRNEKLGFKIREAQLQKIPYMLTIGDREVENKTVAIRLLSGKTRYCVKKEEFMGFFTERNSLTSIGGCLGKKGGRMTF